MALTGKANGNGCKTQNRCLTIMACIGALLPIEPTILASAIIPKLCESSLRRAKANYSMEQHSLDEMLTSYRRNTSVRDGRSLQWACNTTDSNQPRRVLQWLTQCCDSRLRCGRQRDRNGRARGRFQRAVSFYTVKQQAA